MTVVATYAIDKNIYDDPNTKHEVSLTTTEYICGNDVLIHLQVGKNLGIRLNNLMPNKFRGNTVFQNEQFMMRKTYSSKKSKAITRSTFEQKRAKFDVNRTAIEQEILEEYAYTDKLGYPAALQIMITMKDGNMTGVIDFQDAVQHQNFIPPSWLVQLSE